MSDAKPTPPAALSVNWYYPNENVCAKHSSPFCSLSSTSAFSTAPAARLFVCHTLSLMESLAAADRATIVTIPPVAFGVNRCGESLAALTSESVSGVSPAASAATVNVTLINT
jgi:hypothetical protein